MSVHDFRSPPADVTAGAGVPLHRQLFLVLHDEIARGALAPGDALPTEQTLGNQFGVSRITVRRALADLAGAGLIERRHGVGSFVCDQPPSQRSTAGGSYMDELRQTEFETEVDVIELDMRTVPAAIADQLGRERALHVLRLRRERRTSEPLMITEAWLPEEPVGHHHRRRAVAGAALPAAGRRRRQAGPRAARDHRRDRRAAKRATAQHRDRLGADPAQPARLRERRAPPRLVDPVVAEPESGAAGSNGRRARSGRRHVDRA